MKRYFSVYCSSSTKIIIFHVSQLYDVIRTTIENRGWLRLVFSTQIYFLSVRTCRCNAVQGV